MTAEFMRRLSATAAAPYASGGRFAYHFAHSKLGSDPVFRALLEHGLMPDAARILDLGCGPGLLAAWLLAARGLYEAGEWPTHWPPAPKPKALRGVELMPKNVLRAKQALREQAEILQGDMRTADFGQADVVVILDVIHYIDYAAQLDVLARARDALAPSGVLLMRVGDAEGGLPCLVANGVDHLVVFASSRRLARFHCRPLREWLDVLAQIGFTVEPMPMSQGTPFANWLLVGRLSDVACAKFCEVPEIAT